jgi:hypothetical protein
MTYMRSWKSHRLTSHTWLGLISQIGRPLSRIVVPLVYVYFIKERWDELRGDNLCHNLVSSMQRRLQAVINANGAYTKY